MVVDPRMMRFTSPLPGDDSSEQVDYRAMRNEYVSKLEQQIDLQKQLIELYKKNEESSSQTIKLLKECVGKLVVDAGFPNPFVGS